MSRTATYEQLLADDHMFHMLTSPEFVSFSLLTLTDTPDAERILVSLSSQVPMNSVQRVTTAQCCQMMFFAPRQDSDASLAGAARVVLSMLHASESHTLLREIARQTGMPCSASRRCCQISGSAAHWTVYDGASYAPILPLCNGDVGSIVNEDTHCETCHDTPLSVAGEPVSREAKSTMSTADDVATAALSYTDTLTRLAPSDDIDALKAYVAACAEMPAHESQSHFGYLCCHTLDSVKRVLEARQLALEAAKDTERRCGYCRSMSLSTTVMMRPRALVSGAASELYCHNCLNNTLRRVTTVRAWATAHNVRCLYPSTKCACVYDAAVGATKTVARMLALPEPHDACYELLHESIFDRRSPLVRNFLKHHGSAARAIVKAARVPRPARDLPAVMRGYTFGRQLDYDRMLVAARRVYDQPDAPTLSVIAVRNQTRSPQFTDDKWLTSLLEWLPMALECRLEALTIEQAHGSALRTIERQGSVFSTEVEQLIFDELSTAENRRLGVARVGSFVFPHARTRCSVQASVVYLISALAMAEVCEVTAHAVAEETAARALAEIVSISRRESAARAEHERLALEQRRALEHDRRAARAKAKRRVPAGTKKEQVDVEASAIAYNSNRVLAKSREPIIKLSAAEIRKLAAEQEAAAAAESKKEAERISNTLPVVVATGRQLPDGKRSLAVSGDSAEFVPMKKQHVSVPTVEENSNNEEGRAHHSTGRLMCEHLLGGDLYMKIFVK